MEPVVLPKKISLTLNMFHQPKSAQMVKISATHCLPLEKKAKNLVRDTLKSGLKELTIRIQYSLHLQDTTPTPLSGTQTGKKLLFYLCLHFQIVF